jgi:RimJ/RimL family protein N-acetyltransferase
MTHPLWPLFDLTITTERLVLRLPTDAEIPALIAVAKAGIHPPDEMPFGVAWTDVPSPQFEREFARHHWQGRAAWTPEHWNLNLAVFLDDRPIGAQSIRGHDFPTFREVSTGSWIAAVHQRKGYGREVRSAALTFAFDGLGAESATSSAFFDNLASNTVSRGLGYAPDGIELLAPRGVAREAQRWRMTREAWHSRPRPVVTIAGLDGSLAMFGIAG